MTAALGCGIFLFVLIGLLIQAAIYYVSWVVVTTYTDFGTFVSVVLAFLLGSVIGSIIGGGVRAVRG